MVKLVSVPSASSATKSGAGPSDAALVDAARAGASWAQEALFRRHVRMAIGLAHRVLAGDQEVDDLVQDCFLQAFQRLDTLDNPQAFAAWLGSIVVRTAHKRLRRKRLLARLGFGRGQTTDVDELIARTAPPETLAELRSVYSIIERLPADERVALILRRVEGFDVPQIAEYMGLSASTVKRRLSRAEARLTRQGVK